jgi:hypothetical protein
MLLLLWLLCILRAGVRKGLLHLYINGGGRCSMVELKRLPWIRTAITMTYQDK